jgi:hypothetical protein
MILKIEGPVHSTFWGNLCAEVHNEFVLLTATPPVALCYLIRYPTCARNAGWVPSQYGVNSDNDRQIISAGDAN